MHELEGGDPSMTSEHKAAASYTREPALAGQNVPLTPASAERLAAITDSLLSSFHEAGPVPTPETTRQPERGMGVHTNGVKRTDVTLGANYERTGAAAAIGMHMLRKGPNAHVIMVSVGEPVGQALEVAAGSEEEPIPYAKSRFSTRAWAERARDAKEFGTMMEVSATGGSGTVGSDYRKLYEILEPTPETPDPIREADLLPKAPLLDRVQAALGFVGSGKDSSGLLDSDMQETLQGAFPNKRGDAGIKTMREHVTALIEADDVDFRGNYDPKTVAPRLTSIHIAGNGHPLTARADMAVASIIQDLFHNTTGEKDYAVILSGAHLVSKDAYDLLCQTTEDLNVHLTAMSNVIGGPMGERILESDTNHIVLHSDFGKAREAVIASAGTETWFRSTSENQLLTREEAEDRFSSQLRNPGADRSTHTQGVPDGRIRETTQLDRLTHDELNERTTPGGYLVLGQAGARDGSIPDGNLASENSGSRRPMAFHLMHLMTPESHARLGRHESVSSRYMGYDDMDEIAKPFEEQLRAADFIVGLDLVPPPTLTTEEREYLTSKILSVKTGGSSPEDVQALQTDIGEMMLRAKMTEGELVRALHPDWHDAMVGFANLPVSEQKVVLQRLATQQGIPADQMNALMNRDHAKLARLNNQAA